MHQYNIMFIENRVPDIIRNVVENKRRKGYKTVRLISDKEIETLEKFFSTPGVQKRLFHKKNVNVEIDIVLVIEKNIICILKSSDPIIYENGEKLKQFFMSIYEYIERNKYISFIKGKSNLEIFLKRCRIQELVLWDNDGNYL